MILIKNRPTCGLDVLLREKIWNYLKDLTQAHGVTVVMSTHYMNEAQLADVIGFLRNGQMVFEGSSRQFLREFNVQSLEMAFFESSLQHMEESPRYG